VRRSIVLPTHGRDEPHEIDIVLPDQRTVRMLFDSTGTSFALVLPDTSTVEALRGFAAEPALAARGRGAHVRLARALHVQLQEEER